MLLKESIKKTILRVQQRKESESIPQGFSATEYDPESGGRRWFSVREDNRFFRFCIDYDGDIKEIILEEKV